MANLVYKRVSTDQQSTARQNLVLDEAGIEDPVVFEEDPGTSSRLHPLQRPKFRELLTYARPGDTVHRSEMFRLVRGTGHILDVLDVLRREQVALRIHDGAFSAMDLTARHPRTGELLSIVKFMVQTLAAAGDLQRDLQRELTYDGLRAAEAKSSKGRRRPAVVDSSVLPRVDRQLLLYQRWLTERLATIEDPEHHCFLRHFATWHQLRRLRATTEKGPLGCSQTHQARQETTQAGAFLTWLADRSRTIEHCRQADLDAWHTEKLATRRPAQTFLRRCMKTGRMPRLALPPQVITQDRAPLHQHRRLAMLRRVLNDDSLPLRSRIVAALVLVYAQPVSRIVRLTIDDITDNGVTVTVRLGDPPSPLPEPVADLMRAYILSHQHLPYASSRSSHWPFPGRQPGQPMNPVSLQVHLREIGVPPQRGRASAIRQLVLQAPAPVVAKALGYHDKTATRLVTEAGGTWSRYAPGDHNR